MNKVNSLMCGHYSMEGIKKKVSKVVIASNKNPDVELYVSGGQFYIEDEFGKVEFGKGFTFSKAKKIYKLIKNER